jgi:hypothetical protein
MTEPDRGDHWGELVDELGVTPPAESEQQTLPAQPSPEPRPARKKKEPRPAPQGRQSSQDWSSLARSLGIDAPDEPVEIVPAETVHTIDLEADVPGESATEEVAFSEPAGDELTESEIVFGEEEVEPIVETAHETLGEDIFASGLFNETTAAPFEQDATADTGEESRKRRRKRRRRTRRPERSAEEVAHQEEPVELIEEALEESEGYMAEESVADTEAPKRSKSRRRRRSKKTDREPPGRPRVDVGHEADIDSATTADDDDDDDSEEDSDYVKEVHKGIPTWEEAVGLVIARNMESRSRHPNGGWQRGGRHRGRDRSS